MLHEPSDVNDGNSNATQRAPEAHNSVRTAPSHLKELDDGKRCQGNVTEKTHATVDIDEAATHVLFDDGVSCHQHDVVGHASQFSEEKMWYDGGRHFHVRHDWRDWNEHCNRVMNGVF